MHADPATAIFANKTPTLRVPVNLTAAHHKLFSYECVIGHGGTGRVWRVTSKKSSRQFALKVMSKAKILHKKGVASVMN